METRLGDTSVKNGNEGITEGSVIVDLAFEFNFLLISCNGLVRRIPCRDFAFPFESSGA